MDNDVRAYLEAIPVPKRRRDAATVTELMVGITREQPQMWGSIIGFGRYHYRYESGREGDAPAAGFAARKAALTVYLSEGIAAHADLLGKLGPHTTGAGCIYLKDVQKIDLGVLGAIVSRSYATLTAGTYPYRTREGS